MTKSPKPRDGTAAETSDESSKCKNNNIKKARRTRKGLPREAPQRRSSIYRGVTRHRWSGRYEAHLWDKHSWNDSQNKKGRQVYLGAYDDEAAAARAYDLAALKYWAHDANLNFPLSTYEEEVKEMDGQSKEEYIGSLRRKSNGFSRGVSKYRGVARHHHNGRWEARIGRVLGNKYLYLGTYATQEEAAMAYDVAAVKYRGLNAVTNFDLSRYTDSLYAPQDNLATHDAEGNGDDRNNTGTQDSCQDIWLAYANDESKSPIITSGIAPWQDLRVDEMMEQTIASDKSLSSTSEVEPEIGHRVRRSFPDDIQTSFGFEDSSNFADDDGIIFGNYDSFASSVLEYEMDSFELDLNLNH